MTRKEAQINYLIRQYDSAMLFTDRDAKLVLLELLSWALRNLSASPIACWPMLLVFCVRCASLATYYSPSEMVLAAECRERHIPNIIRPHQF